jgi:hypothetical protein
MNPAPDSTTSAGNGGSFDPRQAAALLDQTTERARRELEPYPPWLLVLRGIGVLAVCGTVWLSVRGQHPYHAPTSLVSPVVVTFGVVNFIATVAVARRKTAGVSGRTRLGWVEITVIAVAWAALFAIMGALAAAGVSPGIVYGIYPATVPLMVTGLAWAAFMAARANWRRCGTALGIAIVGAIGVFAGPAGAWAVDGVGLCVVLLGTAAVVARRQHESVR